MLTSILACLFVGIFILMYVFSGGWKQYGGFRGFPLWLKRGGMSGLKDDTKLSEPKGVLDENLSQYIDEVQAILQNVYQDFFTEVTMLKSDIQLHNERLREVESSIEKILRGIEDVRDGLTDAPVQSAHQEGVLSPGNTPDLSDSLTVSTVSAPHVAQPADSFNALYFKILDDLQSGTPPSEIAKGLSIDIREVELVRELMAFPIREKNAFAN